MSGPGPPPSFLKLTIATTPVGLERLRDVPEQRDGRSISWYASTISTDVQLAGRQLRIVGVPSTVVTLRSPPRRFMRAVDRLDILCWMSSA
jgi:hypothetical protein